jgi:hypothetical protein
MKLLLRDLNPNIPHIMGALLGLAVRVMTPVTYSGAEPGAAPFLTSLIGSTGVGKNPTLNMIRCLWGSGFYRDAPQDTGADTSTIRGDGLAMAAWPYAFHIGIDVRKTHLSEPKTLKHIASLAAQCFDGGGGNYSTRTQSIVQRSPISGALIITGECDFSQTQIAEAQSIADRICLLEWGDAKPNNAEIGRELNSAANRAGIAAWGFAFRAWLMLLHFEGRLIATVETADNAGADIVGAAGFDSSSDKQRRICAYLISGLSLFQAFLRARRSLSAKQSFGLSRETSTFMRNWVRDAIPIVVADRLARAKYLRVTAPAQIVTGRQQAVQAAICGALARGDLSVEIPDALKPAVSQFAKTRNRDLQAFGYGQHASTNRPYRAGAAIGFVRQIENDLQLVITPGAISASVLPVVVKYPDPGLKGLTINDLKELLADHYAIIRDIKGKHPRVRFESAHSQQRCLVFQLNFLIPDDDAVLSEGNIGWKAHTPAESASTENMIAEPRSNIAMFTPRSPRDQT